MKADHRRHRNVTQPAARMRKTAPTTLRASTSPACPPGRTFAIASSGKTWPAVACRSRCLDTFAPRRPPRRRRAAMCAFCGPAPALASGGQRRRAVARPRARDRASAVVHQARAHPQHGMADCRRALHRRTSLPSEPRAVPGLLAVLGVCQRPAERRQLRPQRARQHLRPRSEVREGAGRRPGEPAADGNDAPRRRTERQVHARRGRRGLGGHRKRKNDQRDAVPKAASLPVSRCKVMPSGARARW